MNQKIIPFKKPEPVIDSDYFGSELFPISDFLQALDQAKKKQTEASNDIYTTLRNQDP